VVIPIGLLERQVREANIEVALDGTQIDAKFVGQGLRVELFALVQLHQHLSEAIYQSVVIVRSHGALKT